MVLIIIVCAIAWGVCRFKKVDFLDTLFIGFLIGIASIYMSGFIGLCTASLTQTEVKTETYKNVNYYISHGKLSAYSKENVYITAIFVAELENPYPTPPRPSSVLYLMRIR